MDEKTTAIVVFGIAYFLIATGRIPHVLIALLGAVALIFLDVLPEEKALESVDLEVILLLAGMMSLAYVVGRTGVFDWAALRSAHFVRGDGFWTLCLLAVLTAVASAFLDNVTVVVLAVPITLSLCRTLKLDPVPFLLSQVFASNIGGAATVVGDPPNIIIASKAGIGFVEFMTNVAPVSIISMGALLVLLYVWFHRDVVASEASRREIMSQRPAEAIKDRGLLIKSGVVLGLTVLGFLLQDVINVRPAFVAVTGASVIVLIGRVDPHEVLRSVEWTTLAFFTGLFILVGGLVETGVTTQLQERLVDLAGDSDRSLAFLIVWFSGVASAIVDNIPFTATMVQVIDELPSVVAMKGEGTSPLWWALAMGADLGGNATLVGASANVIVVSMARANGYPISFMHFLKYGAVISVVTLVISTAFLWLRFYL
ncbi:MAG: ArsB/NhaD family transporter [Chloroflexi bacterium]|nr:ArsB/NhaD family transporter [Chloroflexota bacterium]